MTDFKKDELYMALKAALAVCETDYERQTVQSSITNLRHECAWADPANPLQKSKNGITSVSDVP